MKKYIVIIGIIILVASPYASRGAIQYGSTTQQASFAASTTQQVSNLIGDVVSGTSTDDGGATVEITGILGAIGQFFININSWLNEHAGIDFFGILKGIGHFFLIIIQFVVKQLKAIL